MIELLKTLYFISIIIWLFPPIRQWKNKLFSFFLILALADPVSIILSFMIKKYVYVYFTLISYLLLISLINYKVFLQRKYFFRIFIIVLISLLIFIQSKIVLIVLLHFIISLIFIKEFIVKYVFDREMNLYYIMLIFYEFTVFLKFLNILLGFSNAVAFYIITTIFQIAFGLFFSIFREDKTRIALKRG
ncbi:MAG: hypothetical protein WHS65_08190 [Melioribacteraceae bacterium]